jgi:Smg protein
MYLFETYMDNEFEMYSDHEMLKLELVDAGFTHNEVDKAFAWLEGLATLKSDFSRGLPGAKRSIRIFNVREHKKLNVECRGFILFLEQLGVLNSHNRELVIDRVMALEGDEIDLRELKWVVMMVLFNQPGLEAAYAWMEDQVFDDFAPVPH